MNNIQSKNVNLFQKFLFILLLGCCIFWVIRLFGSPQAKFTHLEFKFIFNQKELNKSNIEKLQNSLNNKTEDFFKLLTEQKVEIFAVKIDDKTKSIIFDPVNISAIQSDEVKKRLKEEINDVLKGAQISYYYLDETSPDDRKDFKTHIKEFCTIKAGTKKEDVSKKYFPPSKLLIKPGFIKDHELKYFDFEKQNLFIQQPVDKLKNIENNEYNKLIRTRKNENKENNYLICSLPTENHTYEFKIFVDDSGDLPIQWPDKLEWNFFLGWGYIWNVLIVLIGSCLDFFSNIFSSTEEGIFFGNLGLGIILTTLLIRTLSWPIYTKSSTFSMNMSLAQPEINKIQEKYILKKDKEDIQKMQMEIFKVYRKHNFSIFSIFISFLQMPILIAMYRALNRFRIPGGIFTAKYSNPFLGFIELNLLSSSFNGTNQTIIRIFLSLIVSITMFLLNKNNFKKPSYLKTNNSNLTIEQKLKQKNQEKTMKIVSYITIMFMFFTSFKDSILSLYWITGNIYTLCQIKINLKIMEKKYNLLKQKEF